MEAMIISLLLFFSNADFSFGQLNQTNQINNTTPEQTAGYQNEPVPTYDNNTVQCSSGGKLGTLDLDGL